MMKRAGGYHSMDARMPGHHLNKSYFLKPGIVPSKTPSAPSGLLMYF
jgi:hypothetical protein